MLVLGGRTNTVGDNVQLEVYETESSEWRRFNSLIRHRHSVWAIDTNVFMHGGFENETPNIPTNSIMKLDLLELFQKTPVLINKLESAIGAGKRARSPNTGGENEQRSTTPPMQSLAKMNNKIRLDRAEVEQQPGGKTVHVPLGKFEEEKKGVQKDTLYNLFLAHLLRPKEWTAQFDGNGYFAFRREHIIALAEECQRVLEEQPMVLRVDAPIKVFGDIHGQY